MFQERGHDRRGITRGSALLLLVLLGLPVAGVAVAETAPPSRPFFRLNDQAKQALVEKAVALRASYSYQTVVRYLGAPSSDLPITQKETNRVLGRSLTYFAVSWASGSVTPQDEFVNVILDAADHVRFVKNGSM